MPRGVIIKTPAEIKTMTEGGKKLREVKARLNEEVKEGANALSLDELAESLILKAGGNPSFKMVKDYKWTICVNVNEGVVHGIPKRDVVFKKGDCVSVDLGIFYKGFHTDTSFSVAIEGDKDLESFLDTGRTALKNAIAQTRVGNRVYDISYAIESVLKKHNLSPIQALVGHGVGRELHEDPQIPCFVSGRRQDSPEIPDGAVFAIEVMYTKGIGDIVIEDDRWTIATSDGKIAALFEETVAITNNGSLILT